MSKPMEVITTPNVETMLMGGVPVPPAEFLDAMHQSQYVLHARDGELTQVPVERVLLPHCKGMHPQAVQIDLGPTGTIYARQFTQLCKSIDGGCTWTSQSFNLPQGYEIENTGYWKVLRDGTFICVAMKMGPGHQEPAEVWVSNDEGQSWKKRSEIKIDMMLPQTGKPYAERYCHRSLDRLQNGTLLWAVDIRDDPFDRGHGLFSFRSTDDGMTWQGPELIIDAGSEGSATRLPSGGVLATLRYQRPMIATDSLEVRKYMGVHPHYKNFDGFKNLFLMDSRDGGQTWTMPRLLTTVYGQTYGYPAAQSDGTVIVVHDTRYGPGPAGSRAMISRDEGQTWEDEVYYLDTTAFTGSYSASVVLEDDTVLTITASSQAGNSWEEAKDHTDLYAIRWRPVK